MHIHKDFISAFAKRLDEVYGESVNQFIREDDRWRMCVVCSIPVPQTGFVIYRARGVGWGSTRPHYHILSRVNILGPIVECSIELGSMLCCPSAYPLSEVSAPCTLLQYDEAGRHSQLLPH